MFACYMHAVLFYRQVLYSIEIRTHLIPLAFVNIRRGPNQVEVRFDSVNGHCKRNLYPHDCTLTAADIYMIFHGWRLDVCPHSSHF